MRTSIILGVMATTLAVAGALVPAFALTQTAVTPNINTNHQSNTQTSTQSERATTVAANVNDPSSRISNSGHDSLNIGVSSQNARQTADASTDQSQDNRQAAANFNSNEQTNRVSQTAVCAVIALC